MRLAERAAHEGRVLGVAEDRPAVDAPGAGDDAVARRRARSPSAVERTAGAQRREAARVAERLEPLARLGARSTAAALPERDGRVMRARQRTALWPPKPNELEIATSGRPVAVARRSSGRASPGT